MTPEGHGKLREELRRLRDVERPKISKDIGVAIEQGDLSENAEYHAAKERQGHIEARIKDLEDKLSRAEVIDPSTLSGSRVAFGATVTVAESDREFTYRIVGPRRVRRGKECHLDHFAAGASAGRQGTWRRGPRSNPGRRAQSRDRRRAVPLKRTGARGLPLACGFMGCPLRHMPPPSSSTDEARAMGDRRDAPASARGRVRAVGPGWQLACSPFALLLIAESVAIGCLHRRELINSWELRVAITRLFPPGFLIAAPLALIGFGLLLLVERSERIVARAAVATTAAISMGAVGWGVTGGRHFHFRRAADRVHRGRRLHPLRSAPGSHLREWRRCADAPRARSSARSWPRSSCCMLPTSSCSRGCIRPSTSPCPRWGS